MSDENGKAARYLEKLFEIYVKQLTESVDKATKATEKVDERLRKNGERLTIVETKLEAIQPPNGKKKAAVIIGSTSIAGGGLMVAAIELLKMIMAAG